MSKEVHTSSSAADSRQLESYLSNIRQGDLISLGAVNLVGVGSSEAWNSTAEHEGTSSKPEGLWSLTIESDAGWYAIITQDCDIARHPSIEPCLVVCPVRFVTDEDWMKLRSGPGSPRTFPFPDESRISREGMKPIADLRFVTSIDKTALLHDSVDVAHPLTGPQRTNFARWVGARYARMPHSDELERNVLPKAEAVIRKLASKFAKGDKGDPAARLVASTDAWYIDGNDLRITFIAITSEASAKRGSFWKDNAFDAKQIDAAVKSLENKIRAGLPDNSGYSCQVELQTLHSVSAAEFRSWSEWVVEKQPDPLKD